MVEALFEIVSEWGVVALSAVTFLSCLALPVPSSLMMLAAGAFVASGDLELIPVAAAALGGAVLGDQTGYQIGRLGLAAAEGWLMQNPTRASVITRARTSIQTKGAIAVFLSRWLFSALGPYVNLLAGGAHMNWLTFTVMGIAGEMVWVTVYIGVGFTAGSQLSQVTSLLGNVTGLASSLVVTIGLGIALWRYQRHHA